MKRSCKNIDITDYNTIKPWVLDCIMRHKKRYDFRRLLLDYGLSKEDYDIAISTHSCHLFADVITQISKEAAERIKQRDLQLLEPPKLRDIMDSTSGKMRRIGWEPAMQQIFDYIAVYSSMDIFKRRMVTEQASSIPGRGQVYGKNVIQKWILDDNKAMKYAKRHGYKYSRKCQYFVKLDIKQCYPTARKAVFLDKFQRDCGNADIVWLWETLLATHDVGDYRGLLIGALPSQWAAQYMISFLYRHAKSMHIIRRGKKVKCVTHMLMFMDDMLLFGGNRKGLKEAVKSLIHYANAVFGWSIKDNWHIRELDKFSIDMMGFIIHGNGKVTVRGRNYIRARRMILRRERNGAFSLRQAKRITSFKGFFTHSDAKIYRSEYSNGSKVLYDLDSTFKDAAKVIGANSRKEAIAA